MTLNEYENKVFDASVATDRLTAIIGLLDEHYFNRPLRDDPASRAWWHESHDNIQDVVGAIFAASHDIEAALQVLCEANVEQEPEEGGDQHG